MRQPVACTLASQAERHCSPLHPAAGRLPSHHIPRLPLPCTHPPLPRSAPAINADLGASYYIVIACKDGYVAEGPLESSPQTFGASGGSLNALRPGDTTVTITAYNDQLMQYRGSKVAAQANTAIPFSAKPSIASAACTPVEWSIFPFVTLKVAAMGDDDWGAAALGSFLVQVGAKGRSGLAVLCMHRLPGCPAPSDPKQAGGHS